jgi:transcriptional regulator with GAF, ATPase, and Fis domain
VARIPEISGEETGNLMLSGSSSGTSGSTATEIKRALLEAAGLLRFRLNQGGSPTKAEALRLINSVLEVVAGRANRVELLPPARIWQRPDESDRRTYRAVLDRSGWNKSKAARELGLSRATFVDRLKALGIQLPDAPG